MAEIEVKDLQAAFMQGIQVVGQGGWEPEELQNAFDEWLGEHRDLFGEKLDPTESEILESCSEVYVILDEVEEQLNEAAGEVDLDKDEDLLRLIDDYRACARVRRLVRELVDPRDVPEAPTEN